MAKAAADIRSLARSHTKSALDTLTGICSQKDCAPAARVHAAIAILDRGWGRAHQTIGGEDGKAIEITIRKMMDG